MHQLFWLNWAPARSSSIAPCSSDFTPRWHYQCKAFKLLTWTQVTCSSRAKQSFSCRQPDPPHTHTHTLLCCACVIAWWKTPFFLAGFAAGRGSSAGSLRSHTSRSKPFRWQQWVVGAALHYIRVCWNHSSSFLTFLFLTGVISPSLSAMRAAAESIWRQLSTPPGQFSWQTFTMALQQAHKGLWICSSSAAPEHTAQDSRNRAFFLSRLPGPVSKTAVTEHSNWVWLNNTE